MKKNAFVRFCHRDAHYYIIISHLSPYNLPFGIRCWNAYVMCVMGVALKICPWSRILPRCVRADLDLIMNRDSGSVSLGFDSERI